MHCDNSQDTTTPTQSQYPKFPSHYRKRRKGIDFYAWQEPDSYIGCQLCSSSDFIKIPGTRFAKDRYVNAKTEADFVSMSTFTRGWYYKTLESGKKVRELGKKGEFLYSIKGCFVDLDPTDDLPINEDIIVQRCRALELPQPTYILRTSSNHFQAVWMFTEPLILNKPELLQFWKVTNKALNEAFADLGADLEISTDPTRYLRNPHKKGAVNLKYPDKPEILLVYESATVTLSRLYYALKDHGYVKQPDGLKKPRKLSAGEPQRRINTFILNNPDYTGTYYQLSNITGVSERAIHYLRENRKIKVERLRVGKTYKIRLLVASGNGIKKETNSSDCKSYYISNTCLGVGLGEKITLFNQNGLNVHFRNIGVWMMTLLLKENGYVHENLIENTLKPGLVKCKSKGGHKFDEKEWQMTIRSALKDEYTFYHNSHWARDLYQELSENHLRSQNPPKTLEKFEAITNSHSRSVERKLKYNHRPSVKSTVGDSASIDNLVSKAL